MAGARKGGGGRRLTPKPIIDLVESQSDEREHQRIVTKPPVRILVTSPQTRSAPEISAMLKCHSER